MELAFASPRAAQELEAQEALQGLSDPGLQAVASAVKLVLASGGQATPAAVIDKLEDSSLAGLVNQLAQAAPKLAPENIILQVSSHLRGRARQQAQSELKALKDAINAAGQNGDMELVSQLQARRRDIQANHLRLQTEEE